MSIVYSSRSNRYIDTDAHEVVQLSNDEYVAMDDDEELLLAFCEGLIERGEMLAIGFTDEDLVEYQNH